MAMHKNTNNTEIQCITISFFEIRDVPPKKSLLFFIGYMSFFWNESDGIQQQQN